MGTLHKNKYNKHPNWIVLYYLSSHRSSSPSTVLPHRFRPHSHGSQLWPDLIRPVAPPVPKTGITKKRKTTTATKPNHRTPVSTEQRVDKCAKLPRPIRAQQLYGQTTILLMAKTAFSLQSCWDRLVFWRMSHFDINFHEICSKLINLLRILRVENCGSSDI